MQKYLKYSDVCLVPRYSELESRSQADVSVDFLGRRFKLPIIPANMRDVINRDIAYYLSQNGYFYIMHRWFHGFDSSFENSLSVYDFIKNAVDNNWKTISISIGVNDSYYKMLQKLVEFKLIPHFITIDTAHAHHSNVKRIIEYIKEYMPATKLIVGNVATAEACEYLIKLGIDVAKVGIGGGSICSTANKTGFHVPMFSCCLECAVVCEKYDIPFIADGGIQEFGDIAKLLTAGATMGMSGKLFAECIDSPAEIINGHKQYRGSTSFELKGNNKHVEGRLVEIKHSVTYKERLEEIKQSLSSSISYAGGKDLSAFNLVNFIEV